MTIDSSQKDQNLDQTSTLKLAGYDIPKSWLEASWKQECGTEFGKLDEKHRKGIVCRSNFGVADNKKNAKTYGPGLLYNPETGINGEYIINKISSQLSLGGAMSISATKAVDRIY